MGVNSLGHVYLWTVNHWAHLPGINAIWTAIGDGDERWVIDNAQQIYRWNHARKNWDLKPGSAVNIDVQNAQRIVMTTALGEMHLWVKNRWILLTETYGTQATINESFVYYTNENNQIFKGNVD